MNKINRLSLAIAFSLTFMIIEVLGGIFARSLAILSDAAHLLTDVFGFGIALLAAILASSSATKHYTYGFVRAEVFGALLSIFTLWIMTLALLYEAFVRTYKWFDGTAEPIDGRLMFIIACIGVVVNICLSTIFYEDHGGAFHDHGHDHGHTHDHDNKNHAHENVIQNIELGDKLSNKDSASDHTASLRDHK